MYKIRRLTCEDVKAKEEALWNEALEEQDRIIISLYPSSVHKTWIVNTFLPNIHFNVKPIRLSLEC